MIFKRYITKSQKCMYLVKNEAFCGHLLLLFTYSHSSGHTIETAWWQDIQEVFFSRCENYSIYLNVET